MAPDRFFQHSRGQSLDSTGVYGPAMVHASWTTVLAREHRCGDSAVV
jgi:hypothetical protein